MPHQAVLYNLEKLQTCLQHEITPERQAMAVAEWLSSSLWQLSLQTAAAPCVNRDKLLCCMINASLLLHAGSCSMLAGSQK